MGFLDKAKKQLSDAVDQHGDKIGDGLDKVAAEAKKHPAAYPEIHLTSAEKGQGIAALRAAIVADALTP